MNRTRLLQFLLVTLACVDPACAADAGPPPADPGAFARLAADRLQHALPDLVVESREAVVTFRTREGDSLGVTVADRASLCREQRDDCSEALARFVDSNARIFRGVADAQQGHHEPAARAEPLLVRAIWADDRVWMQSAAGELSSITALSGASAEPEPLGEPVAALCAEDGHPVVATCHAPGCKAWSLQRRVAGRWRPFATVPAARDQLLGLSCEPGQETLLTTRRLVEVMAGREHAVALSEPLPFSDTVSVLARSGGTYVGYNQGELGGGLRRIDPRNGRISVVQRQEPGHPCQGLLVPSCDPVQAIVTAPWDAQCVAVAVGLVHRTAHGRIVEVCGTEVRRLYAQRVGAPLPHERPDAAEPAVSVAFTGLAVMGDELVAVGHDRRLYRIARDGTAQVEPVAEFRRAGGVSVSFGSPDVALILTDVFRHDAQGGALPLLVPR